MALVQSAFDNPVRALMNANYIGILAWAVAMGLALRHASETTRAVMHDLGQAITRVIQGVIRLAPLGIFGLVAGTFAQSGLEKLLDYAHLLAVLLGCMLFVALVVNPFIVWTQTRRNPYPGADLPARERGHGLLHAQLGRQHPGEPGAGQAPGPG